MRKWMLLSLMCLPLFGAMCPTPAGSAVPLSCGDPLDGTNFGFMLDVPGDFSCTSSFPFTTDVIQGFVTYEDAANDIQLLVLVGSTADTPNQPAGGDSGVDCNDIGPFTNTAGIEFDRCRFDETEDDGTPRITFSGSTPLAADDQLILISVVSDSADGLEYALNAVLEGMTF